MRLEGMRTTRARVIRTFVQPAPLFVRFTLSRPLTVSATYQPAVTLFDVDSGGRGEALSMAFDRPGKSS